MINRCENQKTEYVYDDAGRLVENKYFNPGDHVNPVKTVAFTYDKVGNLLTYDDGVTSGEYFYDNAYRKVSETVNYGYFIKTNDYTYLKNGLKEKFTGPDDITYGYLYDANNQLTGVQIPNSGFITISEYTWNRPKSMILPGGSTKTFEYDPLMRVKSITAKDPGQNVLLNYQYTFDKMDNITSKVTGQGDYAYDYDDLYRLADVDNPDFNDEAFTYDGVGNRLTAEGVAGNWSYNTNNELTGYDDVSYVYDANGNMTQKTVAGVVAKFFYNLTDRLTEVRDGSDALIASYYYDPFGRRLWKEVSGVRTYFCYADEGLIGEYDSTGTEIKTYGYKPGSTWTTDPLFMKEGSSYYFYHTDSLGTPQKMTAVNGAVVWSAKYSSFGEAIVDASTVTNLLRFPGQYYDIESGLHYNWHRYYHPKLGRYIKIDPLGVEVDINYFVYVNNNPLRLIDPQGLMSDEWAWWVPEYGNFGGPGYSGGKEVPQGAKPDMSVDAKDHLDQCFKDHDWCYWKNKVTSDEIDNCNKMKCDQELNNCMERIGPYPWMWKNRPPKWKYGYARNYRDVAGYYFKGKIKKGKKLRVENKKPPCN